MQLLPDDIAPQLPPLYSQEEQGDNAIAGVKFFTPWTGWTWYASEYDPDKRLFFGVVVGQEREFGYFSLDEMEGIRGSGDIYAHFRERLATETCELFYAVLLDNKHRKLRDVLVSKGSLTASIVHRATSSSRL